MSLNKENQTTSSQQPKANIAVPFVTFNESTKKFIINEEAIKIISKEENKQIGILSLVGKYRTGKSFLLNRVLIDKKSNKGFDVGPTIKPCTKGIWLWSSPLIINNNYSNTSFPAYLIDTEGLGAYDEEINHDSKIFLIAILISSLFIYNSFGTIDEVALNNLSFILNLSKSLKIRNNSNSLNTDDNDEEEMAKYFPSLLWILRDFALKLEDNEGNVITAKQYLENALMNQKGSTESIEEKNLVRKMIKTYFLERDCFPMVRPVENERDLQKLQTLSDDKIRPEFLRQSEMLRNKIYMKIKPKNFNGKILSGQMLINLLESIIEAINEGAIPVIENSWKYITNNECLKSIRENVEYFTKLIKDYQKENITKSNFFNDLQEFGQSMIEEIVNKFKNENSKRFDDINEYVHKLKLNLNQEFKKLNEENIILLKEKYILDLEKEINSLFQNKDKLLKENHINFISNLLQIKYKLDASIPDFHLKDQISYDKIIDTIKKYIEEYFVKPRNSIEQEIQNLKMEKQFLDEKYKNLSEEYKKDKEEFKQTVNNYNDMLIESKLKIKTNEEKIKNFESEKKTLKETNERTIKENSKGFEEKIEKMKIEIDKLKLEIKAKEEDLLVNKLNDDKVSALNIQKISLLEKECEQWKERYNVQSKELSENKNILLNLNSEMDKLKSENKNLKMKQGNLGVGDDKKLENFKGSANNFFPNNTTNAIGGNNILASSKLLIELLSGQNAIKDYLKDLLNKNENLVNKNKDLVNKNRRLTCLLTNKNSNSNNNSFNNSTNSSSNSINTNNKNYNNHNNNNINKCKSRDRQNIKSDSNSNSNQNKVVNRNVSFSKILDKKEDKLKNINKEVNNNIYGNYYTNGNINKKFVKIKITNSVLKKDITGKPFLEYICEVKNGNEKYLLNKKFGHFMMLYKSLKTTFKDNSKLPNAANLFVNMNDKQNSSNENKLEQLDKYISELLNVEEFRNSLPFKNFFELNEQHGPSVSDYNLGKYKLPIEHNNKINNF